MEHMEVKKDIMNRLKTIKGHVQGIEKMVEEGKKCNEILLQIAAVKSSLEKIGYIIIEGHAKDCLLKNSNNKEEVEEIIQTIIKFLK